MNYLEFGSIINNKKKNYEFKKGKLSIGKSDKKVKKRKQAIAIALREAGIRRKNGKTG